MDVFIHIPKTGGSTIRTILWRDIVGRSVASMSRPDVCKTGIWNEQVGFRIELDHAIRDINEYRICLGDLSLYLPVSAHALLK